VNRRTLSIPVPHGELAGVVHLPAVTPAPVVVCCHGLLSSKDGSKYVALGEAMSRGGLAAVRFDFSGCGGSSAFCGDTLLGCRLQDLDCVMDFVNRQPWMDGRIGLVGSSFGGYVALLAAASRSAAVRAVVCWATPFDLENVRRALESTDGLRKFIPQGIRLGAPVALTDLPPVPRVLVIHGQRDETVPWMEATAIHRQVAEPRRLVLMETADHRFLDPSCRELAIRLSLNWFYEHRLASFLLHS
jgi:pimeloyl-ACP methyl ester carboxylesterase